MDIEMNGRRISEDRKAAPTAPVAPVALVTGSSSGIGRAAAIRLAQEGYDISCVSRNMEALKETASRIRTLGRKALVLSADLARPSAVESSVRRTINRFGHLDALVNAAGIIGTGTLESTSLGDWDKMMAINLRSIFLLTKAAVPYLEKTKGSVVNVSSITGLRAFPGILAYCVSKAGVDQLTRCAALELASHGIRVNAVNPGVVKTSLHRRGGMDESAYRAFLEHSKETHPMGRVGKPEDVAECVAFLVTRRSDWITGVTVSVDGGRALTCSR